MKVHFAAILPYGESSMMLLHHANIRSVIT